ncbi:MAG: 4-hydroxythreonine-4-phosphate dehydrogenase PdxA [Pseudomonadota bacterium]
MSIEQLSSRIVISTGEPAGIGPDIIIQLLQDLPKYQNLTILIDPDLFAQRTNELNCSIQLPKIVSDISAAKTETVILPITLKNPVKTGELNYSNAAYLVDMLDKAYELCVNGSHGALVTGPIQKSVINNAGIKFSGHTEYLAQKSNDVPVMLLSTPGLNVALATTHLPLHAVPAAITKDSLQQTIEIILNDMRLRFGIEKPRMIVCGLNPHAGEDGHLGSEEKSIIEPVINEFVQNGENIMGPLPADTAFRKELRKETDIYLAMYHDQGLPVLKTLGFGEAVNITLGLPIIRTSVDHGTALELAGSGKANYGSLKAAIDMAVKMAQVTVNTD